MRKLLWLTLAACACQAAAIDPARDILIRWPAPEKVAFDALKRLGAKVVFTAPDDAAAKAWKDAGFEPVAELSGAGAELEQAIARAQKAGFTGVCYRAKDGESAVRAIAARHSGLAQFVILTDEQVLWNVAPAIAILEGGMWPGVRPREGGRSGASESPWIDANSYLVEFLRGVNPGRPALLAAKPPENTPTKIVRTPPHAVELALIEAVAAGGNALLTLQEEYRKGRLSGEARAQKGWDALVLTAAFLRARGDCWRQPLATRVALAATGVEQHGELLNMMYRRNAAPAVVTPAALPAFSLRGFRVLVASGVPAASAKAALAFAAAGGELMAAPSESSDISWVTKSGARKTGSEDDRDLYQLGKGRIVAFRDPILDPSEFALDVLDAEGWRTRDVRVIGAEPVVAIPRRLASGGLSITLINYGVRPLENFMLRVNGTYNSASRVSPETAAPAALKATRAEGGTEIELRGLDRLAIIELH